MFKEPTLENLRQGNNDAFASMYDEYKEPFIAFAQKYGITTENAIEVYQESVIKLYENIASGKLRELTSSIKTYLFSIGKYKIMEHLRATKKTQTFENVFQADDKIEELEYEENVLTEQQRLLKINFSKLGERCQNILEQFYLYGKTISEIVEQENYENQNTVKAQKSRCLKQLKTLISN